MQTEDNIGSMREDLLRRSREEHERLEALIAPLSDEELTRPGVTDDWSVKDHLAHLTWWEQYVIAVIGGAPNPVDTIPKGAEDESEDEKYARENAYIVALTRDQPLTEVRTAFDASYREMLHLIASAPDDVFSRHHGRFDGNAASHYEEHRGMIQAWLERTGRSA